MYYHNLCMGCMKDKKALSVCPNCGWNDSAQLPDAKYLPLRTLLADRYLIGKVLRETKYTITYLARSVSSGQKRLIKEYFPEDYAFRNRYAAEVGADDLQSEKDFNVGLKRFFEDSKLLQKASPLSGIASTLNSFSANQTAYRVMEYIEGKDLEQFLLEAGKDFSFDMLIKSLIPVMAGLESAHQKDILHFDIHPQNIIMTSGNSAVLTNFMLTEYFIARKQQNIISVLRTGYSPFELYLSQNYPGPWVDVYALAATIYYLCTGKLPSALMNEHLPKESDLRYTSLAEKQLSIGVEKLLKKALSVNTGKRFQSVKSFKAALLRNTFSKREQKTASAITAFTQIVCPGCGAVNEFLILDLGKSSHICTACQYHFVEEDIKSIHSTTKLDPDNGTIGTDWITEKPRSSKPKKRSAGLTEDFHKAICKACGKISEVLKTDVEIGVAICLHCSTPLPKTANASRQYNGQGNANGVKNGAVPLSQTPKEAPGGPGNSELRQAQAEPLLPSGSSGVSAAKPKKHRSRPDKPRHSGAAAPKNTEKATSPAAMDSTFSPGGFFVAINRWIWVIAAILLIGAAISLYYLQKQEREVIPSNSRPARRLRRVQLLSTYSSQKDSLRSFSPRSAADTSRIFRRPR